MEFLAAIGFPEAYPVHQPGYPGWIGLGTLLAALGIPPYAAFVVWSLAASILTPVLLCQLLRRFVSHPIAWWSALGYGVNGLAWFHGVSALNYSLCSAIGLGIALLLMEKSDLNSPHRRVVFASLLLAAGLPVRPDLLLWYAPLIVFCAAQVNRRAVIKSVAILGAGAATFLLFHHWTYSRSGIDHPSPSVGHTLAVILRTSVFHLGIVDGLLRTSIKLAAIIGWSMGLFAMLFVLAIRDFSRGIFAGSRMHLAFLIWFLPDGLFMFLFHMSEAGPLLLVAPIYAMTALGLNGSHPRSAVKWLRAAVVISILQFTFYPWSADSIGLKRTFDAKVGYLSAQGLRNINRRAEIHTSGDTWQTKVHRPTTSPSQGR